MYNRFTLGMFNSPLGKISNMLLKPMLFITLLPTWMTSAYCAYETDSLASLPSMGREHPGLQKFSPSVLCCTRGLQCVSDPEMNPGHQGRRQSCYALNQRRQRLINSQREKISESVHLMLHWFCKHYAHIHYTQVNHTYRSSGNS